MSEPPPATGPPADGHGLLVRWARACRDRSLDPGSCRGPEAALVAAMVETALDRGVVTPDLARAVRTWAALRDGPAEALACLGALRRAAAQAARTDAGTDLFEHLGAQAVEAAAVALRRAARADPLTGCGNRLALEEDLSRAMGSARRSGLDVAVAVVDLDGLKAVNDSQGHAAGDAALVALVGALRRSLRGIDALYRIGGDEFVVLAPSTGVVGAMAMLRRAASHGGPPFSWGVAGLVGSDPGTWTGPADLLAAADADLYARRRARRRAGRAPARRRVAAALATGCLLVTGTAAALGHAGGGAGPGRA
ncbi:MAG TPA: GGDEF domain-containing protein, partial [Acidimicrobiales bacterium]|nr:GGDEF domain-containing protein [Acidimicrobiales bacterium]